MKIIATIQILPKTKEGTNTILCPCLIKLQAITKTGKKTKEFKNLLKGKNIQEVLNLASDYFFSVFTKPTSFVFGSNSLELINVIQQKKPLKFEIIKTIQKESPPETISVLEKILEEFTEINPDSILPQYLLLTYENIVTNLGEKEGAIQLALYLKMIANYFNAHPEQLIDDLPIFISMKNNNLLPENIETVEDFLIHISS